jgi:tetratricopeptide (TPR) repeat protein
MSGGLKPHSNLGIIVLVGVLASIGLYLLPKTLLQKEEQSEVQPADSSSKEMHTSLTDKQIDELSSIRLNNLDESTELKALSDYFAKENIFDSAAFFQSSLSEIESSESNWLKTGDLYYQAYSLSLNPVIREKQGELAREAYQKVLSINPRQLQAKTNSAMTYASSASPMQTIMMLRQILEENPRYIPAIMSMGALSMQSGQYDKAISRFEQVLTLEPESINAKLGLAYSLIESGDTSKAKLLLIEISRHEVGEILQNEISNTLKSLN